ncbi:sulfatase-like hydrolase/transferase [Tundrisphaera sp. TA3]|uniref:sulfatase n=1 Tax=Tundrisphaera sp. TA3 TaxID=3435775 RepID=UPI003EBADBB9
MTDSPAETRPGPASILAWAAWFGLAFGELELAAFLLKCHVLDPRNYNISHHFPWMIPVAGLILTAIPGLVLAALAVASRRRVPAGVSAFALAAVASLGFLFRWPIYTAACLVLSAAIGLGFARLATRHPGRFRSAVRWTLPVLVGLVLASAVACSVPWSRVLSRGRGGPPEGLEGGPKNAILIVLDTVRARSLSLHGYDRDTTPNLARWAARGVRFDQAYATAPWTAPSHAGMFTGRWPHELKVDWKQPLEREVPTLAWFLGNKGFDTAGFVANVTYCSYETGLAHGFDHYEDYPVTPRSILMGSATVARGMDFLHRHPALSRGLGLPEQTSGDRKDAARIRSDFLGWLDRRSPGPNFAFLNFFDAHHPYFPPEGSGADLPGAVAESPDRIRLLKTWWEADKSGLTRDELRLARDAYDRCIAALDAELGRLLDDLDRRGAMKDTLVIITADHGEHLGEHGVFGHGVSLGRPEIHVPLVVLGPGIPAGAKVETPVSLRDLPATVVGELLADREAFFPGDSLARFWTARPEELPVPPDLVLSEVKAPPEDDPNHGRSPARFGPLRSIVDATHHYIRDRDGRERLFDLARDPDEDRDLAPLADSAPILGRFRELLPR